MSTRTDIEQLEVYNLRRNIDARNLFHVEAKGNTNCMQYMPILISKA